MQFYRIEVGIMPPDHQGDPITRSVLRRFSHFQKLQRMVRPQRTEPCTCPLPSTLSMLHRRMPSSWDSTLIGSQTRSDRMCSCYGTSSASGRATDAS